MQPPDRAEPPRWLGKKFHAEFREIGEILRQAGLYTELDRDVLGQFLVARERWLRSDRLASAAIRARDEKLAKEWTAVQSSYFRQCRQCAEVMGLSISSRCRLVVPEVLANAAKDEGEEDEFTRALKDVYKRQLESHWTKAAVWTSQRKTEPHVLGVLYEIG